MALTKFYRPKKEVFDKLRKEVTRDWNSHISEQVERHLSELTYLAITDTDKFAETVSAMGIAWVMHERLSGDTKFKKYQKK